MLSDDFKRLLNEAELTKEMLGFGVTQLRKADYSNKGIYFQSFVGLSTGLERMGKMCIMIDHHLNHNKFPSNQEMKSIGHDIQRIYDLIKDIAAARSFTFRFIDNLDTEAHQRIIKVLSGFSKGDRYSNIDLLVGKNTRDPISEWYNLVDQYLFENCVTKKQKDRIKSQSDMITRQFGSGMKILHIKEDNSIINDPFTMAYHGQYLDLVGKWRQFYALQIIRYFCEVLYGLRRIGEIQGSQELPFFSEVFRDFYHNDKELRSRKKWSDY